MWELLKWVAVGVLVGSLVGARECASMKRAMPNFDNAMHIGICAAIAGFGTALLFLIFGLLLGGQSPFATN